MLLLQSHSVHVARSKVRDPEVRGIKSTSKVPMDRAKGKITFVTRNGTLIKSFGRAFFYFFLTHSLETYLLGGEDEKLIKILSV